jgi:hypothetical protein
MFLARLAVELGVLLLIATAVNVPVGLMMLRSRLTENQIQQVASDHAGQECWVWQPPAATGEWPTPTRWSAYRGLGLRYYTISADHGNERYQMQVQFAGFPFAAVALPQMWWPARLGPTSRDCQPDPGVQLQWAGLLLNPPIMAAGAWVLLFAPFEAYFALRWRRRLARRLCPYCAYPAGRADVCTECGRVAVAPLRV